MFKILFATDGSPDATAAGQFIQALSLPPGTAVHVLSVVTHPLPVIGAVADGTWAEGEALAEILASERDMADRAVQEGTALLAREGLAVTSEVREGPPGSQIIAAADDWGADLVVVGSKGLTGLDELLLGSVARNVAKHGRRPVVIAREPRGGLGDVVVATDGSAHAQHAVTFTQRLPLPATARITVTHVLRPSAPFRHLLPEPREKLHAAASEVDERVRSAAQALADETAEKLVAPGRSVQTAVLSGDPATEICTLAGELGADLIVAGARGVNLIEGLLTGSVADRLLKEARCSVLIVH